MAPDVGSALSRAAQSARTNTAVALLDSGPVDSALGFQEAASEAASGAKEPATTAPIEPPQSSSAPGAALFSSSPQSATNQKQDLQAASASGAPETPATAPSQPPPLPPPADIPPVDSHIQLGSLVQVTTEHADARFHHGAWGTVYAMLADNRLIFENKNSSIGGRRVREVPRAWCCVLAKEPTPPGPWKNNLGWLQANHTSIVR